MRNLIGVLLLAAGGCSSFTVDTDYEPGTDFRKYTTWSWFAGPKPSGSGLDGLTEGRIRAALESQLPKHGLAKGTEGATDLLVAYNVSVTQRLEVTPTTMYYGYGWGHGYVGSSYGGEVRTYDEGTLIVDFIDAKTKSLIWRGTARGTVYRESSPEERQARIQEAIAGILERYPPAH